MEVVIKREIYGSVAETFHESYTYSISNEEAKKIGEAAGLIAKGVSKKSNGYEFFLNCEENEAIEKVKNHNGVILKIENK